MQIYINVLKFKKKGWNVATTGSVIMRVQKEKKEKQTKHKTSSQSSFPFIIIVIIVIWCV